MLSQPIGLVIIYPNITLEITRACAQLKPVTLSEYFYSLEILRMLDKYNFGRFWDDICALYPGVV